MTKPDGSTAAPIDFDGVKAILEAAVGGQDIGEHGNFWRTTLDALKTLVLFEGTPRAKRVIITGDGANSNLILALRGLPPFDGTYAPQMPEGFDPVAPEKVDMIEQWINSLTT